MSLEAIGGLGIEREERDEYKVEKEGYEVITDLYKRMQAAELAFGDEVKKVRCFLDNRVKAFETGPAELKVAITANLTNRKMIEAFITHDRGFCTSWEARFKCDLNVHQFLKIWDGVEKCKLIEATPLTEEDKKAIEEKQGLLWECIGRTKFKTGWIYHYKWRGYSQDKIDDEMKKVSPAIERIPDEKMEKYFKTAIKFGYGFRKDGDNCYIDLPNREYLQARLIELYPDFTEVILNSEGIASREDFVRAFLRCFFLLSDGKEFVHHHQLYAIVMLSQLKDPIALLKYLNEARELVKKVLHQVENSEKVKKDPELKKKIISLIFTSIDLYWASPSAAKANFRTLEMLQGI